MNGAAASPAVPRRGRRALIVLGAVLALLLLAWQGAALALKRQVLAALGPEAQIGNVHLGLGSVVLEDLRVTAPKGWPGEDTLRAKRLRVEAELASLFSDRYRIGHITVEQGYLSMRRTRDGKLQLLPSLLGRSKKQDKDSGGRFALRIDQIELKDSQLDFHDASLKGRPARVRIEALDAKLDELDLPGLGGRSKLQAQGRIKGRGQDGTVKLAGWLEIATRESDLTLTLRDVDLVPLEPYLLKAAEAGVARGQVDLDLHSQVKQRRLKAPGKLVLKNLELRSGKGVGGTFMGVSRKAVIASLKSGGDRIDLDFTLEGDLDNPRFALNETLSVRLAVGMAASLGIGLVDVVKDVGSATGRGIEAVGDAVGNLFGGDD
ncbi:DUF748 domain-containing protein [Solimonas sp. K1W22B-7]|uniref:DUF748 domain-containing protein n=1 Tax=Solimonas sp. K1W22B-7 TaxID=2303331 RepID=UPI000E334D77|nr:DUF748 domain-containing protein [Solimonas sp. K1W22B-7]AXQ30908.1 DUF748 domain-containing protein [Solimonas sp. K1W22B-7]